jgi:hypothetical protein
MKYGHYTIEPANSAYGEESAVVVYGWGRYGRSSVLSGQRKKVYLDQYESTAEALQFYPDAEVLEHIAEAGNTFDHLPDSPDYY